MNNYGYPELDLTGVIDFTQVPDDYIQVISDTYNNLMRPTEDGREARMPKWMRGYMVVAMEEYYHTNDTCPASVTVHRLVCLGMAMALAAKENGWSLAE